MNEVANTQKIIKRMKKVTFQNLFLCSHLSTVLDRNPEMSMFVIFVPCMNKSPIGRRLASIYSVSAEDVPNGASGIFLANLSDFMKEMVWFKKTETKDLVKGLDELVQKLDVVASVIFPLIDATMLFLP